MKKKSISLKFTIDSIISSNINISQKGKNWWDKRLSNYFIGTSNII